MHSSLKQEHSFNFSNTKVLEIWQIVMEKSWNFINQDVWEPWVKFTDRQMETQAMTKPFGLKGQGVKTGMLSGHLYLKNFFSSQATPVPPLKDPSILDGLGRHKQSHKGGRKKAEPSPWLLQGCHDCWMGAQWLPQSLFSAHYWLPMRGHLAKLA